MPAADRPRRENVNKPKDLYVPDVATFEDDLSVDSDVDLDDEDSSLEDASINTDESDEVVTKSGNDDEYENDSFVVPDDEEEEVSDGSYSDSEGSFIEESETGSDYESDPMDVDDAESIDFSGVLSENGEPVNMGDFLLNAFKKGIEKQAESETREEREKFELSMGLFKDTFQMFGKIGSEDFDKECDAFTERTKGLFEKIRKEPPSGESKDMPPDMSANLFSGFFKFMNAVVTSSDGSNKEAELMEVDDDPEQQTQN
ncbi:hypothetical protein [Sicyoidochytrium minutum DNA virus]|nr:hypothetical protein [Sicyoidochytrium minutum DNA virus]